MPERVRFTKNRVAAFPVPATGRATYYDEAVQKLAVRITAAGSRTFYVVKRAGAEMVWLKLGTFPDMTVECAREEAEKALGGFATDQNPATIRRARRKEMTVGEFFDKEYNPRHLSKLRSGKRRKNVFNNHVRPHIGSKKLSDVDRQMVVRILGEMDGQRYAGHTINHVRNLVSGMFRHAVEWGFAVDNPVTGVRGRKGIKRERFLRGDELPRFFNSLAAESNETLRDYLLLSLLTGARRGNVLEMRWRDVQLDEGVWTIGRTKNEDPQNVTLSPEAIEVLRGREGCHVEWVFPGRSKRGHMTEPKSGWKRILDRDELERIRTKVEAASGKSLDLQGSKSAAAQLREAKAEAEKLNIDVSGERLPGLWIHDLRRTLGSWQAKTGASLVVIGKSLNHKSLSATAIYARLDLDPVRQSVNSATSAMLEAGGLKAKGTVETLKKVGAA